MGYKSTQGYSSNVGYISFNGYRSSSGFNSIAEVAAFTGVQIGRAIVTGESVWVDSEGVPTYDLLPTASRIDPLTHPELYGKYLVSLQGIEYLAQGVFYSPSTLNSNHEDTSQPNYPVWYGNTAPYTPELFESIGVGGGGIILNSDVTVLRDTPARYNSYTLNAYVSQNPTFNNSSCEVLLTATDDSGNQLYQISVSVVSNIYGQTMRFAVGEGSLGGDVVLSASSNITVTEDANQITAAYTGGSTVLYSGSEKASELNITATTREDLATSRYLTGWRVWQDSTFKSTPTLATETGSPHPYKIVADYTGGA